MTIGQNKPDTKISDKSILSLPKVDKRIELLSIVSRMAGFDEYNQEPYKRYVHDIHEHFDKYKNHPLIAFAQELRDSNGIGYDVIMEMAIHLNQPSDLKPSVSFSQNIKDRWGIDNANKFVVLLQKFYADAECNTFFKSEENIYSIAEGNFMPVFGTLDLAWYKKYYGKMPNGKFNVVIGLGNGHGNYGPKIVLPNGKEEIYAIMGTWSVDSIGQPKYNLKDYFSILLHEFNHSFVNYLTEKNEKDLEQPGMIIFKQVSEKMKAMAYGDWQTMLSEALVRASVIKYLKTHEPDGKSADRELVSELGNGFVWMKELVNLLSIYENNRQKYPTLERFMPEIISFYKSIFKNIEFLKENYSRLCPRVLSIEQFKNFAKDVDPSITEIKIIFDKPLRGKGWSIGYGTKGKDVFPITNSMEYSDNNTAIRLKVELKPDTEYQFVLLGLAFKTTEGYPLDKYEVSFKTRK